MSTDHPTLGDFDDDTPDETESDDPDQDIAKPTAWFDAESRATGECLACGEKLSQQERRVVGDNNGNVPACTACTEYANITRAVRDARGLSDCPGYRS